jgi:hypothetical protein
MNKVIVAVLLLWAGLLLGVSFVATPAKFLAPSLPMTQALDVGRSTFHVLAQIEWAIVVVVTVLLVPAWRSGTSRIGLVAGLLAVAVAVLAVETFVLRPRLDARVLRIIAGESVPPSQMHTLYIALEALRLVLILAAGLTSLLHTDSSMNRLRRALPP